MNEEGLAFAAKAAAILVGSVGMNPQHITTMMAASIGVEMGLTIAMRHPEWTPAALVETVNSVHGGAESEGAKAVKDVADRIVELCPIEVVQEEVQA